MNKNYKTFKLELWEKFKHQCAYCGTKLYEPLMADVDRFSQNQSILTSKMLQTTCSSLVRHVA